MIDAAIEGALPAATALCAGVSGYCGVQWATFRFRHGDKSEATCLFLATSLMMAAFAAVACTAAVFRFGAAMGFHVEWLRVSPGYLAGWVLAITGTSVFLRTVFRSRGMVKTWRACAAAILLVWAGGAWLSLALR